MAKTINVAAPTRKSLHYPPNFAKRHMAPNGTAIVRMMTAVIAAMVPNHFNLFFCG